MSSRRYPLLWKPLACLLASATLLGCDPAKDRSASESDIKPQSLDTPYAVWPSAQTMTAYELGDLLKQDENAANALCNSDTNRPKAYTKHFSLVSTSGFNRTDALEKYDLDASLPVTFGNTGKMLAEHLGDFLAQKGAVDPANAAGRDAIKLTFSNEGQFTGYCDTTSGYTNVVNVVLADGRLTNFSTPCDKEAVVVCMSVRD